jgi:hypothetical protein
MRRPTSTAASIAVVAAVLLAGCTSTGSHPLPSLTATGAAIVPQTSGTGSETIGTDDAPDGTVFVALTCHGSGSVTLRLPPSSVTVDAACTSPNTAGGQVASRSVVLHSVTGKVRAVVSAEKNASWKLLVSKDE